jgi:Zn-finger protein
MIHTNGYDISEKLFIDIWEKWGCPDEISDGQHIVDFINDIISLSHGLIILDHFSYINFDRIQRIEFEQPFLKIFWKSLEKYRSKYVSHSLTEEECIDWASENYYTYVYVMLNLKRINILKINDHLIILFRLNLTPKEYTKQLLINSTLISEVDNDNDLYREYTFLKGDLCNFEKHSCLMCNLPFYSLLIQPKQNAFSEVHSKKILLLATLCEIDERMEKILNAIDNIEEHDDAMLTEKGNSIRKSLEYCMKYYCLYNNLVPQLAQNYSSTLLGKLTKAIKQEGKINVKQSMINVANDMSHDSGKQFTKEDLIKLWSDSKDFFESLKNLLCKGEH